MSEAAVDKDNVGDEDAVKRRAKRAKHKEKVHRARMRKVLAERDGRYLLWWILEQCGVYRSIWESSARIHYNAGQQDVGHRLMAEIIKTDRNAYLIMQSEAMEDEDNG